MLKGLGNLANLGSVMKQAQEMGAKMQTLQAELKQKRVTGSAGGGLVQVECNGVGEAVGVTIDPSLLAPAGGGPVDRELLEDLLPAAFNDAAQKAKQLHAEAVQELTGGLNLPGMGDALSQLTGGDK
ncbi:MAG: YbaB/EbfC family nucleoid-associated protein [Planctomycetota bacterium]